MIVKINKIIIGCLTNMACADGIILSSSTYVSDLQVSMYLKRTNFKFLTFQYIVVNNLRVKNRMQRRYASTIKEITILASNLLETGLNITKEEKTRSLFRDLISSKFTGDDECSAFDWYY